MKFRSLMIYLAALCVTVLMLFGVRAVQSSLDAQVEKHHMRYTGNIKNAPPLVAITTVALGSFRGIIADLLWLRAESLKNQHSYYEMVQLAQWITDLQPSFSGATRYLAWNMAYNISVTCSSSVDRWRWVNEGIRLLRDKAIEYNPDDPGIYKELAWFYAHKLGNVMDDANVYYKNRLAVEMQRVFGRFPEWETMAAAPVGRDAFLREYPAGSPLWEDIPGDDPEEKYQRLYAAFLKSAPELPPEFKHADAKVLAYLRAELLRERYRLDARKILAINTEYGELDWRTPEAQAIYWARESIEHALAIGQERDINTDRIINNALYQSFLSGRVMRTDPDLNKESGIAFISFPNLSLVDAVYRIYTESQTFHDGEGEFYSSFRTARINFVKEAVYILYAHGAFKKAEEYYKRLVDDDGPQKREVGGTVKVAHSLAEFAQMEWIDTIKNANAKQAQTFLGALLYSCIVNEINGDHDTALLYERSARYVYDYYVTVIGNNRRMEIPSYAMLKRNTQDWLLTMLPPAQAQRLRAIIRNQAAKPPPPSAPAPETPPAAPGK